MWAVARPYGRGVRGYVTVSAPEISAVRYYRTMCGIASEVPYRNMCGVRLSGQAESRSGIVPAQKGTRKSKV